MSEHPGRELKKLRESKGITLEQAARDTCLRAGLLQALEESSDGDLLPSVYQKLSLRMYARYLGLDFEVTRRATRTPEGRVRIAPVGIFLRRMGRPVRPPKLDPSQRNRLLTVAKTTSAAIVTVLAVGLWSLNAKISRLHLDEPAAAPSAASIAEEAPAEPAPLPQTESPAPSKTILEETITLSLAPIPDGNGGLAIE